MRILLFFFLLFITTVVFSQQAVITLNNGTTIKSNIQAISDDNEVYTEKKQYAFDQIKSIIFFEEDERFDKTYQMLEENNIKVFFQENDNMYPQNEEEFKQMVINTNPQQNTQIDKLYVGLERFRRSYSTGTALIAAGTVGAIAVAVLSSELDAEPILGISVLSLISYTAGVVVMANSGKHLKNIR